MPQAISQRVLQLIELAASSSSNGKKNEEARTAALLACQLIKKHGLTVVMPEDLVTFVTGPEPAREPSRGRKARAARQGIKEIVSNAAGDVMSSVVRDALRNR